MLLVSTLHLELSTEAKEDAFVVFERRTENIIFRLETLEAEGLRGVIELMDAVQWRVTNANQPREISRHLHFFLYLQFHYQESLILSQTNLKVLKWRDDDIIEVKMLCLFLF